MADINKRFSDLDPAIGPLPEAAILPLELPDGAYAQASLAQLAGFVGEGETSVPVPRVDFVIFDGGNLDAPRPGAALVLWVNFPAEPANYDSATDVWI
jgi:hypothetical protein